MLIQGDARALPLCAGSVDCVVTSPPYFSQRDYGTPNQLGLEATPTAYVQSMVEVFREVGRVLKDDGTLWLNLGDSYARAGGDPSASARHWDGRVIDKGREVAIQKVRRSSKEKDYGDIKPKDLIGIPWRVAFALQADGWYLRSDIIWAKPNPMPESVTDRPTKAHEYLFLLTKQPSYYYDAEAIKEPIIDYQADRIMREAARGMTGLHHDKDSESRGDGGVASSQHGARAHLLDSGKNKRDVWSIPTQSYIGAHFATMPEALVEPCILAGCRPGGRVLDPFVGSGTVLEVAQRLGRLGVGVDLTYQGLAKERTAQRGLLF